MTVGELIKRLSEHDPNLNVYIEDTSTGEIRRIPGIAKDTLGFENKPSETAVLLGLGDPL
ncbi:hypothetical protein [Listeria newyorkensis]|uniref:Uncharacterized protein n=1 Tax=Listeria newyorkensis TaxID=1497681 RepID=A0A841Z0S2_9LIST|nr:hypothetical protein [Listeria newyorkensis]MBC1459354.1 hypothetical protein [Listeria newyorkensis]